MSLSGHWFDQLPPGERADVESMIGEVFPIDDIDEHGPWVSKIWPYEEDGACCCRIHTIALEPAQMALVDEPPDAASNTVTSDH